jgi:protein-tyrosine kinase
MSKFFNATLKARNVTVPDNMLKDALQVEQPEKALPGPIASPSPTSVVALADPGDVDSGDNLEESRLKQCRKIELPLGNLARVLFRDGNSFEAAEESYRALRTRLLRLRSARGLHSVVVTSAVQGEGKTLTSLNLALCCAQIHEMRILLVDADIRTCGLSRAVDARSGPGLADVLSGQCKPEEAIRSTDRPNLYLLSSGAPTLPAAELFANRRWQEFMAWCGGTFKLTLVDSPPVLNLSDAELITAGCDGVLMVVRALYTKRQVLQKCAREIDPKKILGVVYNGTDAGTHYGYRAAS